MHSVWTCVIVQNYGGLFSKIVWLDGVAEFCLGIWPKNRQCETRQEVINDGGNYFSVLESVKF